MQTKIIVELVILLLLILANGLLAMAEMAIVSARKTRLQVRAEAGNHGARVALELAKNPTSFIATIQVGITLISILTGGLAATTLSGMLAEGITRIVWLAPMSDALAIGIVVVCITFFSLVLGELTPKRLALNNAEEIAARTAPAMKRLERLLKPLVKTTSWVTELLLRLISTPKSEDPSVTEDEVRQLIEQGAEVGVFEPIEEEIVGQLFRLSDRTVSALITPRTDIIWLDLNATSEEIRDKLIEHPFAQFPVANGDLDAVVGVVLTQDLLVQNLSGQPLHLQNVLRQPLFIPESTPALEVMGKLQETGTHIAFVIDEYGGLEGILTIDDLFEAIIGDLPSADHPGGQEIVQRDDGSYLLDGMYPIDDFKERFDLNVLPDEEEGYYQTLGGFMMRMLEKVPTSGDHFEYEGLRLEVMDMDGRRVDKVLVERKIDSNPDTTS